MDKKMPRTTVATGTARLLIIAFACALASGATFGVASAVDTGYVFVSRYRVDNILTGIFCSIGTFLLALFDAYVYNNEPKVVERRAAKARAARAAGEGPKSIPSAFAIALKKPAGLLVAIIIFSIYGTVVPMAFEAATNQMEKLAVYFVALIVCKTGGEYLLKRVFERINIPFHSLVMGLFSFELVTSTQARILLASYPDTSFVAIVSVFTAFFELGVRLFNLFKVRFDLAQLRAVGLDEKNRKLFMRKARIYAVVG